MTVISGSDYGFRTSPYDQQPVVETVHEVLTANAGLPVTLEEARAFVGHAAEDTSFDTELTVFIKAAQRAIEHHCELVLLDTEFLATRPTMGHAVPLDKRPFLALDSIEYSDVDAKETVAVDADTYLVARGAQLQHTIYIADGQSWPASARRPDSYRIQYHAGWANAASIPGDIKLALLTTVEWLDGECSGGSGGGKSVYEMQHGTSFKLPDTVKLLLAPYKLHEVIVA